MLTVVGFLAALLACDVLVRLYYIRRILPSFESKPPFAPRAWTADAAGLPLTIPGRDGLSLAGRLHMPQQPPWGLVLFCPEMDGHHRNAPAYTAALSHAGCAVLAFDFSNQGESAARPGYSPLHWPTQYEDRDLHAVLKFVRNSPALQNLPLGVMGMSRGGATALAASIHNSQVQAIACEGAYTVESLSLHFVLRWAVLYLPAWATWLLPRWHIAGTVAAARMMSGWRRGVRYLQVESQLQGLRRRPVLLITGERDNYVPPQIAEQLAMRIGGELVEIWRVPGAKHNQARQADPQAYDRRLVAFFRTSLMPQVPSQASSAARAA